MQSYGRSVLMFTPASTTVPLQWPMNASSFWRMLLLSLGADKPLAWMAAATACATLTGRGGTMLSNAWLSKADRQVLSAALGSGMEICGTRGNDKAYSWGGEIGKGRRPAWNRRRVNAMLTIPRRQFVIGSALPALVGAMKARAAEPVDIVVQDGAVQLRSDGLALSPADYARLLGRLADDPGIEADEYSRHGVVASLEARFAALLGKDMAVYLPTGTLANHLALRRLARDGRRVLVQQESHVYNDEGDCAQQLSGLTLVPLAPGRATFTLADVEAELRRVETGRVHTAVGAISIESPVRRIMGEVFDFAEMQKIAAFARERRIGLHLDGARLFLASAYTGDLARDLRGIVRHRLCVALQIFQRRFGCDPRWAAAFAGKSLSRAAHVRRRLATGMARCGCGATLSRRLSRSLRPRRGGGRCIVCRAWPASALPGRAATGRYQCGAPARQGRRCRCATRSYCAPAAS